MMSQHDSSNMADASRDPVAASAPPRRRLLPAWALVMGGVLLILGAAVAVGLSSRAATASALVRATHEAAVPFVAVTRPTNGAKEAEIALPGSTQAFIDTPIYARTSGYVRRRYVDIGDRVKQGQLLAEIETPEIDHQLEQARADLQTAQANLELAKSTAVRWRDLRTTNAVSAQETDEKIGDQHAKEAMVASSAANVRRLEQLQAFQRVYAPFAGLITARHTDVGALIDAGANAPGREMFRLASTDKLRVYIAVPEVYVRLAKQGTMVRLTLDQQPGRKFTGTLVRTSNAIDAATHTLLTEIAVDNARAELLPGAYVMVHLPVSSDGASVTVPANALLFRAEGPQVGVVRQGKVELVSVQIGRDYGTSVEILAGLTATDQIVVDPPDGLAQGAAVRIAPSAGAAPATPVPAP